jgi:hypothetical protein
MRNGSSEEATRTIKGQGPVVQPPVADPAGLPAQTAAEGAAPRPATEVVRHGPGVTATASAGQDSDVAESVGQARPSSGAVRYGPGVPAIPHADQLELTAERVWRADGSGRPSRPRRRLSRLIGGTLTLLLLAASGALLYLRIHHAPFHVTGVAITQQVHNRCGVNVTGQIATNGSAGTVSYQWLIEPSQQPPQPLSQSVLTGQHAVYVTVAVEGTGHGSASQTVMLQVLGPDNRTVSEQITVSC